MTDRLEARQRLCELIAPDIGYNLRIEIRVCYGDDGGMVYVSRNGAAMVIDLDGDCRLFDDLTPTTALNLAAALIRASEIAQAMNELIEPEEPNP